MNISDIRYLVSVMQEEILGKYLQQSAGEELKSYNHIIPIAEIDKYKTVNLLVLVDLAIGPSRYIITDRFGDSVMYQSENNLHEGTVIYIHGAMVYGENHKSVHRGSIHQVSIADPKKFTT
ncbi:MAG: hypothetical protein INQ03_17110 [Candidatus Heimdallarchaeota archaeon]|nr:hypothetical protein [Candidatus Heimdallarchaeota archaeon]